KSNVSYLTFWMLMRLSEITTRAKGSEIFPRGAVAAYTSLAKEKRGHSDKLALLAPPVPGDVLRILSRRLTSITSTPRPNTSDGASKLTHCKLPASFAPLSVPDKSDMLREFPVKVKFALATSRGVFNQGA